MKSWGNRKTLHKSIAAAMTDTSEKSYAPPPELPEELIQWLTQLTLLYGMPIEYMVADERLMPLESVRFFFIDRNWLDRLVDGALSVGVLSSKEAIFNETFFEDIYAQIDQRQTIFRSALKGKTSRAVAAVGGVMTGMLFRSQVVSSWPGVEVVAYKNDGSAKPVRLPTLRMDLLSDNLLFCLFGGIEGKVNGVPDKVEIIEPGEGLHFGLLINPQKKNEFSLKLRGLGYPTEHPYPAGQPIPQCEAIGSLAPNGVVDIQGLVKSVERSMPAGAIPDGKLMPGSLAIQLVYNAGIQQYDWSSPVCDLFGHTKTRE